MTAGLFRWQARCTHYQGQGQPAVRPYLSPSHAAKARTHSVCTRTQFTMMRQSKRAKGLEDQASLKGVHSCEQEIVGSNIGNEVNSHPVDVDGNLIRVSPIMCGAVMAEHPAHARETGEAHPVKGMMRRRINVSTRKPVSGDRDEPGQRSVKVARL